MRTLFLVILLLAPTLLVAGCSQDSSPPQRASATIGELHGQWIVINYWAKWCKPCIKEIPELNELDEHYAEVTVLGVNYDGATGEELAAQLKDLGIEFAMLTEDPATSLNLPRPVVLPTTIILDPTGKFSQTLIGPQTTASLALATGQSGPR
jgi:thiol-disulfide isomerase/thioredoxin